ncbi:T9SS type A sorting domain-containing protein [Fibrella sp. ES10-3-2-2]|nr:hypothetical protein A6C57_03040 [Fibrella sp. ES10-3-2-2]
MKIAFFFCYFLLGSWATHAQAVLFLQNFSAGNSISNYVSSNPGIGEFNAISGATITNSTIQFDRSAGTGSGHFSRSTDLGSSINSLYVQMDFEVVSATTAAGSNVVDFYVGSAFDNTVQNPANADVYARFGFNFTNNGHQFSVRHIPAGGTGAFDSPVFTGKQTLTFVLNNSGRTVTYLQPGGGTQTLTNDTYDLWVGTTEVFNSLPVLTPTQTIANFKLRLTSNVYAAVFQFDNLLIRDINNALAVSSVADFKAAPAGSRVDLSWQVYKSVETSFVIERSFDALSFTPIGNVPAASFADGQRTYIFSDSAPGVGSNYYRLRQTAADGSPVFSKIVAAIVRSDAPKLAILDNPTSGLAIHLKTDNLPDATYQLSALTGQNISCEQRKTPDGQVTLLLQHPLPSGVYLLTATSGTARVTQRLLMQ